jgi:hypothetical protein
VECYVHGYLPEWADCLAFDGSVGKCCHHCLVVSLQVVPTCSGLSCPGALCMYHSVNIIKVDVFGFMPLWDRVTEELRQCVYARQGVSWSEIIASNHFQSSWVYQ